jgi:transcriptional regulator with XRE-family HTH domain
MAATATPAQQKLALRLRQVREQLHLTQAQLAAAFSVEQQVGAATISSWENLRTPATPPENRVEPYARLAAHASEADPGPDGRPDVGALLVPLTVLSNEERRKYERLAGEIQGLWEAARGAAALDDTLTATYRSWYFDDDGPLTIIFPDAPQEARSPLADPRNPNYTQAHAFADVDALIELFGHIRAENDPTFPIAFVPASGVLADHLSGHLVMLGGIGWNDVTQFLLQALTHVPVSQIDDPDLKSGDPFIVRDEDGERKLLPQWARDDAGLLVEDVGLLARTINPFNSNRTLTLCNGIHSRGVLGAVRTLTDLRLRETNESYLADRFPGGHYAIAMRVPVIRGQALSPDLSNPHTRLFEWSPERS